MSFIKRCAALVIAAVGLLPLTSMAKWPEKPIKLVVAYPAGSLGDTIARLVVDNLHTRIGTIIVENKPGAGGNIGMGYAAESAADGYTFVVGATNNFVINQYLYKNMRFDPLKALDPVTILVDVPNVVFINSQTEARNFREFSSYAKNHKGQLSYGSSGTGTMLHLTGELVNRSFQLGLIHVPFKGSPEVMTALLGNNVQMYVVGAAVGLPYIKSGKIRALAVSGNARLPMLPETPTFQEVGLGAVKAGNWWAIAAPHGTPPEIIDSFQKAVAEAMGNTRLQSQLKDLGVTPVASSPLATARRMADEARYWQSTVGQMNITLD